MTTPLRCLQIEDSESDAAMVVRLLEKADFQVQGERVESASELRSALSRQPWDIIIADYHLPSFDALKALKVLKESGLDIPFIAVSGKIGEEIAVEMMKNGAADYLVKNRLDRLAPAVERELRDAETRRMRTIAESSLSLEKERLLITLRSIGEGVIATDVNGAITLLNPVAEELTGWTMADAFSLQISEIFQLLDPLTGIPCPNPGNLALKTGKRQESQCSSLLIDRNGIERLVAYNASPIMKGNQTIIGAVLVLRDVTNEEKINEILRNSEKLKSIGILAGGIAHDFNNLLSSIFGNIELAQEYFQAGDQIKGMERLKEAYGIFNRAKDLAQQLLTFARGGKPILQVMSIAPILTQSPKLVLSGSNVIFNANIPENLWLCDLDENQIGQVIDNIVLNARQAMPDGGQITISATNLPSGSPEIPPSILGDVIRVSINDNGPGIDPKNLSSIFDPFFTTKQGSGNGLGLSIVFSIMKQHNGHVRVESQLGKGTTFFLYIPRINNSGIRTAPITEDVQKPKGHGRVLVMDDEKAIREVLLKILETCGYSVSLANDSEDAISQFRAASESSNPFTMVFLDLTIRGGSGGQKTVTELRRIAPEVFAVATSGYANDPVMVDPSAYGFSSQLAKPFSMKEIYQVIHKRNLQSS